MAIGKEFYPLIRSHGGLALDYASIAESDFAAASGVAYTPPEESNFTFRRIVASRTLQILAECPALIETFQTSSGTIRLPANTVADVTNDSGDGRLFVINNAGTGSITISDYLGSTQFTLLAGLSIIVLGKNNNTWDFIFTGKNTWFNNAGSIILSTDVEDAIKEVQNNFNSLVNSLESPGTTWVETPTYLGSGEINYIEWTKNSTRLLRVDMTYDGNLNPLTETWSLYASDGTTVLRTVTTTYTIVNSDMTQASSVYA